MARTKTVAVPEVGGDAPEFSLPSAQGGQLRLSMRTARGPVILIFYGDGDEDDVRYFEGLAAKEDEINMAGGTVVGIGVSEPDDAREFVRKTGMKSYVLYDYARAATRDFGLLEGNKKSGEHARPAAFIVGGDHKIAHAWVGERPEPGEILTKISEITGLPRPAEEAEGPDGEEKAAGKAPRKAREKPEKDAEVGATEGAATEGKAADGGDEKPKKMSVEERERIKAERRAARAEGKSLKQADKPSGDDVGGEASGETQATEHKRLSPEEREKRRAERRAAREAGGGTDGAAKPEAGGEAKDGPKGDAGEAGEEG